MPMRKFVFKGGYGEHGRSCFLVQYNENNRYYMVDCGIMDSDEFPYPKLTCEEMERVDYIFLTHCHKDHVGALQYAVENGFCGWIVTSKMTAVLEKINYSRIKYLPMGLEKKEQKYILGDISMEYGASGHCPGGLWFCIEDFYGKCFFSGDYQEDTLLYRCDKVYNMTADIAVIDCAHSQTELSAEELRRKLQQEIGDLLELGHQIVLPVPKYGRGIEMLAMLKQYFPYASIKIDTDFVSYSNEMLQESCWYKENYYEQIKDMLADSSDDVVSTINDLDDFRNFDILLMADTHLQKKENMEYVNRVVENNGLLIVTGRIKKGSFSEQLLEKGKAKRCIFPHHQSRGDMKKMIKENDFRIVYPYHNLIKEVYMKF